MKIHLDTLEKYLAFKHDVETIVFQMENHKEPLFLVAKVSDVRYILRIPEEQQIKKGRLVALNSLGDSVDLNNIFMEIPIDKASYDHIGIDQWYIDSATLENGDIKINGEVISDADICSIIYLEQQEYPKNTGVFIKSSFSSELNLHNCVIDKVERVSGDEFDCIARGQKSEVLELYNKLKFDRSVADKNCILIVNCENDDGLLINTQGYDYARYISFIPRATLMVNAIQNVQTVKFYSPLYAKMSFDDGEYDNLEYWADDIDSRELTDYKDVILEAILKANSSFENEKGLMEYWQRGSSVKCKVLSAYPTVEVIDDELMGVMEMKVIGNLTEQEIKELKEEWRGQYSDGWGEGFEQRSIKTCNGELFVSFWSSNDNYFINTEVEQFHDRQISCQTSGMSM